MPSQVEKAVQRLLDAANKDESYGLSLQAKDVKNTEQTSLRDSSASRIIKIGSHFGLAAETCLQAVKYFDVFLSKVKVPAKYMEVTSISSLVLASKMYEEEEHIPCISDMLNIFRLNYSVQDVIRMEKLMLDKFGWQLLILTPLAFIEKFCNILSCLDYFTESEMHAIVSRCTTTLLRIIVDSSFLQHSNSTVALAVLSYELSFFNKCLTSAYCQLSTHAGIHDSELMHCEALLRSVLDADILNVKTENRRRKKRTHSASVSPSRTMPTIWESGDEVEENDTQRRRLDACHTTETKEPQESSDIEDSSESTYDDATIKVESERFSESELVSEQREVIEKTEQVNEENRQLETSKQNEVELGPLTKQASTISPPSDSGEKQKSINAEVEFGYLKAAMKGSQKKMSSESSSVVITQNSLSKLDSKKCCVTCVNRPLYSTIVKKSRSQSIHKWSNSQQIRVC